MATLTVRQPASPAARAVRHATWARRGAEVALPRRSTPVLSDLYTLLPPTGTNPITLPAAAVVAVPASDAPADTAAAGWFDSTWELQQGLDVAEGLPVDVPLEAWLQVYLTA